MTPDLFDDAPQPVGPAPTLAEQIAELEREVAVRRTFYSWLFGQRDRDTPMTADPKRRWLVMEAALETMRKVATDG